jgi:ubiquinone/menaquinone biosynthesis C-methylase UbiE
MPQRAPEYVLRHSDHELRRLARQHGLFAEFTRQLLLDAGVGPGMRVLDVGTGAGDVALLAAELVGPAGEVVGVDTSAASVARARARAERAGLRQVEFVQGDAAALTLAGTFDAVVGRFVLAWVAEPARLVAAVARRVRPGGVVAFQDFDHPPQQGRSFPEAPLFERAFAACLETLRRVGFDLRMGARLGSMFAAAELPPPRLRMDVRIGGGPDFEGYAWLAESVRSLLPRMLELGVIAAGELDVDELAARVRDEVVARGGVMTLAPVVGAWSELPGAQADAK